MYFFKTIMYFMGLWVERTNTQCLKTRDIRIGPLLHLLTNWFVPYNFIRTCLEKDLFPLKRSSIECHSATPLIVITRTNKKPKTIAHFFLLLLLFVCFLARFFYLLEITSVNFPSQTWFFGKLIGATFY